MFFYEEWKLISLSGIRGGLVLVTTDLKGEETPCPAEEVFADVFSDHLGTCDLVPVQTGKA